MTKFACIACSNCDALRKVDPDQETATCFKCETTLTVSDRQFLVEGTHEEVVAYMTHRRRERVESRRS